jgi:hypothetical protein
MLFPTTLVGSYPQPDWLIDRKRPAAPGSVANRPDLVGALPRRYGFDLDYKF